jgi:hypothetical protein
MRKVRAERRCGELLRVTAESGQRATAAGNVNQHTLRVSNDTTPTLADMGLTRDESSRYQQLAAMPVTVCGPVDRFYGDKSR